MCVGGGAWQRLNDLSRYNLSVGSLMSIDLVAVLNGQPLQLTDPMSFVGSFQGCSGKAWTV